MAATKKLGKASSRSIRETLATVEILAYRAALLISFLVYAYKQIKAEMLGP
jgi:hypothetical protein